ncbi:MAG: ROK family protein [Ferruginibacter sp.]|nr:ROK family protein [Cytophagales bacterium]
MEKVVIGIDVGGTSAKLGVVNRAGTIRWQTSFSTQSSLEEFFARVGEAIQTAQAQLIPAVEVIGIGVGAPAANARSGTLQAVNMNWSGNARPGPPDGRRPNFREALSRAVGLPVVLDNDANATALGEMYFGAAQHLRDFILVTLGTGLGSGFVVNGNLVYGSDGLAGEMGHICVDMNGRDCACGRKGCLETYVSANGLKRTVFELLAQRRTESPLRGVSYHALTARMVSEAAEAGDPIAAEAFELTGKILGLKLADAVAHTSPEAIILFGGLAGAGKLIFEPTARYLKQFILHIYRTDLPLLPSALPGSDAAVLGAAALAWDNNQ